MLPHHLAQEVPLPQGAALSHALGVHSVGIILRTSFGQITLLLSYIFAGI